MKLKPNSFSFIIIGISLIVIGIVGLRAQMFPAPYGYFVDLGHFHVIVGAIFVGFGGFIIYTQLKKRKEE